MLKYLADNYEERATIGDKSTLEFMRNEAKRLEGLVKEHQEKNAGREMNESLKGSEHLTDADVSCGFNFFYQ